MRIERAVNYIGTLGPGKRLCVWVNGCSRRCTGCVSARLQEIDPTTEVGIEEFFGRFSVDKCDGVTISGGEPFDQPAELSRLIRYFRERGVRDILVYTGYTIEELRQKKDASIDEALSGIAVLIDGPYVRELDDQKNNLKGSSNQRILFLQQEFSDLYETWMHDEREMQEMVLGNTLLAVGIPDEKFLKKFRNE